MGWDDRPYYRDRGDQLRSPLAFLFFGSVPLFTAFGIRVRAHMSLFLFIAITILYWTVKAGAAGAQISAESMIILFGIVILHEYGHCFASRWVGGDPDEVILTPLGGGAFVNAPHRPGATFVAVLGGPLVNVAICLVALGITFLTNHHHAVFNPFHPLGIIGWIYSISLALLLFNLLPIFPFDGGQMLQALLWYKYGHHRSMMIACVTGIICGSILALVGLRVDIWITIIAVNGIYNCVIIRQQLQQSGGDFDLGNDSPLDFSSSLRSDPPARKRRKVSRWVVRRLRRQARRDAAEQQIIDDILAKVSAHGINALTWSERRALKRATDRQRQRELELSRND